MRDGIPTLQLPTVAGRARRPQPVGLGVRRKPRRSPQSGRGSAGAGGPPAVIPRRPPRLSASPVPRRERLGPVVSHGPGPIGPIGPVARSSFRVYQRRDGCQGGGDGDELRTVVSPLIAARWARRTSHGGPRPGRAGRASRSSPSGRRPRRRHGRDGARSRPGVGLGSDWWSTRSLPQLPEVVGSNVAASASAAMSSPPGRRPRATRWH